jgi:hypothetical protein
MYEYKASQDCAGHIIIDSGFLPQRKERQAFATRANLLNGRQSTHQTLSRRQSSIKQADDNPRIKQADDNPRIKH